MKARKYIGVITAIIACLMLFVACKPQEPVPTPSKKPTDGDVCTEIIIKQMPSKLVYESGERFNPSGLIFDAVYQNGFDGDTDLTGSDLDGWTPAGALDEDVKQITLLFEGVQKQIDITVTPKTLLGVEITSEPDIRSYSIGDKLDLSGLMVKASYEEGDVAAETRYVVTDASGKVYKNGTVLDTANPELVLTVSVTAGEVTMSDTFTISVYAGFTLQAEDYWDPAGDTPRPTDRSYTILSGAQIEDWLVQRGMYGETFTGSGYIGNITTGVSIEFYIYSEIALENAELVLVAASTCTNDPLGKMDDMRFNEFCKVYVGDSSEEIYIDDSVIIEGKPYPSAESGGNQWTNWTDVTFGTFDIQPGYNKIKIDCVKAIIDSTGSGRIPNIDRLDVRVGTESGDKGDFCEDIIIKTPPKTEYYAGETFDLTGIVFDAVYRNGYDGDIDLDASKLRVIDNHPLTTSDTFVTVKYKNCEKQISVTVTERTLADVEITNLPQIVTYSAGSPLNLGGLIVKATYTDGHIDNNAKNYTIKDSSGKTYADGDILDGNSGSSALVLTVSITSGGVTKSGSFTIHVFSGLSVEAEAILPNGTEPDGQSYVVHTGNLWVWDNGTYSGTGYVCNVVAGTKMEFYVYSDVVVKNARIILRGASTLYNESGRKMDDMQINKIFKVYVGNDNKEVSIPDEVVIEGKPWDPIININSEWIWFNWADAQIATMDLVVGYNKITVECINDTYYSNKPNIDRLDVLMPDEEVTKGDFCTGITISPPPKTEYFVGESFDLTGIVFSATYQNGYDGDSVLGADSLELVTASPLTLNDTSVTVRYKGYEKAIAVTVRERKVESVQIASAPTKTEYTSGDALDLTGLIVKANYEGGVTADNVTDYVVKDKSGVIDASSYTVDYSTTITVEITSGGVTKSVGFDIKAYVVGQVVTMSDTTVADGQSYAAHTSNIWDNGENGYKDYACGFYMNVETTFYIYSDVAVENVQIILRVASGLYMGSYMGNMQLNKMFKVYTGEDNTEVAVPDTAVIQGCDGVNWFNWVDVQIATMDLAVGYNKITLKYYNDGYPNPDGGIYAPNIAAVAVKYEAVELSGEPTETQTNETAIIKENV